MICKQCSYTDRTAFVFCPMCGAEQTNVSFSYPSFALLGDEFNVVAHMDDQMSLYLRAIEYAGQDIKAYSQPIEIRDGTLIPISITRKPQIRNNHLILYFEGFPNKQFNIQLIEPNEIVFKVQRLYDFRPFGANKEENPILSFSIYDNFVLELENSVYLDESLHIEIESGGLNQKLQKKGKEYFVPYDIYPKDHANLKLVSGDIVLTAQEISLHYNQLPRFEIENEQDIMETNFNIATPNSAFSDIQMKIRVDSQKKVTKGESGSDLKSFQVSSDSKHIEVNRKKRFENPEDLIVKLAFKLGSLTDDDIMDLSQRRQYEFSIDIIINANKELPFKPIKRFKFALPVLDTLETAQFAVIDFGTTNSCFINDDGKLVPDSSYETEHTTRIDFLEFGNSLSEHRCSFALGNILSGPKIAINFKGLLMKNPNQRRIYKDSFDNFESLTPLQLSELYMRYATDTIINFNNKRADKIVATFPAMFNRATKQLYLELFDKLGYELDVESSITEPEAIAFYYLNENPVIRKKAKEKGELLIAIFDCGGGTTDFAIVKYKHYDYEPIINVMASWGTDKFSGIYLSYVIAKCLTDVGSIFPEKYEDVFLYDKEESRNFSDRYVYFENKKIDISNDLNSTSLNKVSSKKILENCGLDVESPYIDVFLGRQPANNPDIRTISSQLGQINGVLYEMFENDQINKLEVDFVVLAGNSCRLPLFQVFAEEEYGADKVIFDLENIKTAVAQGAYIYKSRADDTIFEGLQRSQLTFYRYVNLGEIETIFLRWLDMSEANLVRFAYKYKRPKSISVFLKDIEGNEEHAFSIDPPKNLPIDNLFVELKYHAFKIECRWLVESYEGDISISDWKEVFYHG